jgi:hypothetical protein
VSGQPAANINYFDGADVRCRMIIGYARALMRQAKRLVITIALSATGECAHD